jgi:hypothetical protein
VNVAGKAKYKGTDESKQARDSSISARVQVRALCTLEVLSSLLLLFGQTCRIWLIPMIKEHRIKPQYIAPHCPHLLWTPPGQGTSLSLWLTRTPFNYGPRRVAWLLSPSSFRADNASTTKRTLLRLWVWTQPAYNQEDYPSKCTHKEPGHPQRKS